MLIFDIFEPWLLCYEFLQLVLSKIVLGDCKVWIWFGIGSGRFVLFSGTGVKKVKYGNMNKFDMKTLEWMCFSELEWNAEPLHCIL